MKQKMPEEDEEIKVLNNEKESRQLSKPQAMKRKRLLSADWTGNWENASTMTRKVMDLMQEIKNPIFVELSLAQKMRENI